MKYKATLEKYGVSQVELAERLGINRVSVSRLLSEKNDLRLSTVTKIANAVGCSVSELLGADGVQATAPAIVCPHCGHRIELEVKNSGTGKQPREH